MLRHERSTSRAEVVLEGPSGYQKQAMLREHYDVFLSYNSQDEPAVAVLADRLQRDGVKVWRDKVDLLPGHWSQRGLERALLELDAVAVVVGERLGPWQDLELRAAIAHKVEASPNFRVIPVVIPPGHKPSAEQLPPFARLLRQVRFRAWDDHDAYEQLKAGIRGTVGAEAAFTPPRPAIVDDPDLLITPKGLRSFDAHDQRFFLRLLPGSRDHRGLPASLAFWKDKLEQIDPELTFRVGLLHGPSGCGKSSLVTAGLLPRLADYVRVVLVQAPATATEEELLRRVRKAVPGLPDDGDLPACLAHLRAHRELLQGCKLVLILDQFEQWLHSNRVTQDAALLAGLAQCDGSLLQAVVMVRVDFALDVHRLFCTLRIPIREGDNMALVDLFESSHARRVLVEFGRGDGRVPASGEPNDEQQQFVDQAVHLLSDDKERVPAVLLALFAYMVHDRAWTPDALAQLGDATSVGRAFLERSFDARTANPTHLAHRKAAIGILRHLLPPPGADIKGGRQPLAALWRAAGSISDHDFAALVTILRDDLRLISPSASDDDAGVVTDAKEELSYELTHDYLVPALRAWLTAEDRSTRRGRARLALEQRAEQWHRDPQPRHLPTAYELLRISALVRRRDRTGPQKKMLHVARWRLGSWVAALAGLVVTALAPAFLTFRVEFAPRTSEKQRAEVVITRWFNPFGYRLGTGIFEEELDGFERVQQVQQRARLNWGLAPDWGQLVPFLDGVRRCLAEIEWLERPVSSPLDLWEVDYDYVPLGRVDARVVKALLVLLTADKHRHDAAFLLSEIGGTDGAVVHALLPLLRDSDPEVCRRAADAVRRAGRADAAVVHALTPLLDSEAQAVRESAAHALVQIGRDDRAAIEALSSLLQSKDSGKRANAAAALVSIGKADVRVVHALVSLLREPDLRVREHALSALSDISSVDEVVVKAVRPLLDQPETCFAAARTLVKWGKADSAVLEALIGFLMGDFLGRSFASDALVEMGKTNDAVVGALIPLLGDQVAHVRECATEILGEIGRANDDVVTALIPLLQDQHVRVEAAEALGKIGKADNGVLRALEPFLISKDGPMRVAATQALVRLGRRWDTAVDGLTPLLKNEDPRLRACVAQLLGEIGKADDAVVQALIPLLEDRQEEVRVFAAEALVRLGKAQDAAVGALVDLLGPAIDPETKLAYTRLESIIVFAANALVRAGKAHDSIVNTLVRHPSDRMASILGDVGKATDTVVHAVLLLLHSPSGETRAHATSALGKLAQLRLDWIDDRLLDDLANHDSLIRERAGIALAWRDDKLDPKTVERLKTLRIDRRPWVRQASLHALYHIEKRKYDLAQAARNQDLKDK